MQVVLILTLGNFKKKVNNWLIYKKIVKMINRIKFYLKRFLEVNFPMKYNNIALFYFKITKKSSDRIVTYNTDICIEGFPRCANSFTVVAFKKCANKELKIATHMHSHTNVLSAIKKGIPTIVLIRKPEDAIISLRALALEGAYHNDKEITLEKIDESIKRYILFYSSLLGKKDSFVVGQFDEVVSNFTKIIHDFNSKFNTNFTPIENVKEVLVNSKKRKRHMFPTEFRNKVKVDIRKDLKSESALKLMSQANKIYEAFIS